jgi:hypothetical protein
LTITPGLFLLNARDVNYSGDGVGGAGLAMEGAGNLDAVVKFRARDQGVIARCVIETVVAAGVVFEAVGALLGLGAVGIFVRQADELAREGDCLPLSGQPARRMDAAHYGGSDERGHDQRARREQCGGPGIERPGGAWGGGHSFKRTKPEGKIARAVWIFAGGKAPRE